MKTLTVQKRLATKNRIEAQTTAEPSSVPRWQPIEIQFVHHPDFDDHEAVHNILEAIPKSDPVTGTDRRQRLVGHEYLLPNRPLLTAAAEKALFLRMNLLRCVAARRQEEFLSGRNPQLCVSSIQHALDDANVTRNEIVEANQRLVVSNASKFICTGITLPDLISEGNLALIKAIDLFDVGRGYRLSTYATYAIRRHLSRFVQREQKRRPISGEDHVEPWIEDHFTDCVDGDPAQYIEEILESLPRRERAIIRMRYGLTLDGKPHTLNSVAERFGISKERVRQLIVRSCEEAFGLYAKKLGYQ